MYFDTFRNLVSLSQKPSLAQLLFMAIFLIICATASPAIAQTCSGIPNAECQALYALYNGTGGDQWTDNTNWLSSEPVDDWYGITVNDGHVAELDLYENGLAGNIPVELGNLTNLTYLTLGQNSLTGSIPSEIGNLTKLERLFLSSNNLSGSLPPELGSLVNLTHLGITYNSLSGSLPSQLSNLTKLMYLYLQSNYFTGSIPSGFGSLTNLNYLALQGNDLTGPIPTELGNLTSLTHLFLFNNRLTGSIPTELGNLSSVKYLYLHKNQLTGSIPPELGNLTELIFLRLSSNSLFGDLPAFFISPPTELDLRWNRLHASDSAVLAAVEEKSANSFMSTQTVPPKGVTAETVESAGTEENRVRVSWNPISYSEDEGGYKIYYRQAGTTDYDYYGMTSDKNCSELTLANLEPGTEYEFRVNAVTWAHIDNQNNLESLDSQTSSTVSGTLSRAFIPVWKQAAEYFTGVVVSNFGDTGFDLELSAYDPAGDLETLGENPASTTVNAGKQKSLLGWEFFQGDPYHEDLSWIELRADNSNRMGSIFLYGINADPLLLLDGAESQTVYAKNLFFTRPIADGFFEGWDPDIQVCLVNPTEEEVTVTCTLKASDGSSQDQHTIPSMGFLAGSADYLTDYTEFFTNAYMEVEVTDGPGVIGFSRIEFPGIRTGLGMNAVQKSSATKMYSAQLAHGSNIVTNLRLVNTGMASRKVILTAIGDNGDHIADSVQVNVSGQWSYSADLGTIFGLDDQGVTTGSLVVESDGPGIIGDIIFADGDTLEYAMSLPLQDRLFKEAVFNHIANLPTVFTGFAFFNPGDTTANILVEAIGTDGSKVAEITLVLDPGERIARTLTDADIWPSFPTQSGGFIKIQSDQPIAGQQLFGDRSLRYMAAIPPTTRIEGIFE